MNLVNRAQVADFKAKMELVSWSESDKFELYAIHSILNGRTGEQVDAFDAHLKGTEFGIDGVAIIVQGTLVRDVDELDSLVDSIKQPEVDFYFFQAKSSETFDYGEVSKFFDAVTEFFDDDPEDTTGQLRDLIDVKNYIYTNLVKFRNPGVHCYFATTGNFDPSSARPLARLINSQLSKLRDKAIFDQARTGISMVGAGELQTLYRAADSASTVQIDFPNAIVLPSHPRVQQGYLGFLPSSELLKIVSLPGDNGADAILNKAVFFDNIRDYNARSRINAEIVDSLERGEQENFVYRNNGITVVAKDVARTGNNFRITDFQVVNGCQTSNVLFYSKDKAVGVQVPFRLIATNDEEFIFSIISGTNRQNPVREEQFLSLLPFMKNLEEYSRSVGEGRHIFLERRENQYRTENVERARIVQMQPFLKAFTATVLGLPHKAARNYKAEINTRTDAIFRDDVDIQAAYAAAYLHYKLEFLWRNQKIDSDLKLYRYYIMDAAAKDILGSGSYLNLSARKKVQFANMLIEVATQESKLKDVSTRAKRAVERQLRDYRPARRSREQVRDTLRLDSFAANVMARYGAKTMRL